MTLGCSLIDHDMKERRYNIAIYDGLLDEALQGEPKHYWPMQRLWEAYDVLTSLEDSETLVLTVDRKEVADG